MAKFKVGDVVGLKSGSKSMTVSQVNVNSEGYQPGDYLEVTWYVDEKFKTFLLHEDLVEEYE